MLLTDEEIEKIDIPLNICKQWMSTRRYGEDVAKAQLKKVVDYLKPYIYSTEGMVKFGLTPNAWQSLKEEVE